MMYVFDMDGVLALIHEFIEEQDKGIRFDALKRYKVMENFEYVDVESVRRINRYFYKTEVFERCNIEATAKKVMAELLEQGHDIKINTVAYTRQVANAKEKWLFEKLGEELLSQIDVSIWLHEKQAVKGANVVVEDSLEELAKYDIQGGVIGVIRDRAYNKIENYPELQRKLEGIIRVTKLIELVGETDARKRELVHG